MKKILSSLLLSLALSTNSIASSFIVPGSSTSNLTSTNGSTTLLTSFSITAVNGTWQNIGISVTLPAAGTYLLFFTAYPDMQCSAGTGYYIDLRLNNTTDSLVVPNSTIEGTEGPVINQEHSAIVSLAIPYTVAASKVIDLQAVRGVCTTWSASQITATDTVDVTNHGTSIGYVRIN